MICHYLYYQNQRLKIYCHLFLMDDKGEKSLFQTEVERCNHYLSSIDKHDKNLLVMDEIFSSTNCIEGMAAASAFCESIYKKSNSLSFITTHHSFLNNLERENPKKITNYKFEALIKNDLIDFSYKIKKGFSQQHLALQLLKQSDTNQEFLENALSKAKEIEKKFI